jgi:hypothetical protein
VQRVLPFELLRSRDGGRHNVAVVKAALAWQGIDTGGVRPPCVPLDADSWKQLLSILESWDSRRVAPRPAREKDVLTDVRLREDIDDGTSAAHHFD